MHASYSPGTPVAIVYESNTFRYDPKVLRGRRRHAADRQDLTADAVVFTVFAAASLCCLYALIGFGDENGAHHANRIASCYVLERVFASRPSGRSMTLHE